MRHIVRTQGPQTEGLLVGLDHDMKALDGAKTKAEPGHVGRIPMVAVPSVPVRSGWGQLVPGVLLEEPPAVRKCADVAFAKPLHIVMMPSVLAW